MDGVRVPPADDTKHSKLMGTRGAGKSTSIRESLNTRHCRTSVGLGSNCNDQLVLPQMNFQSKG